MFKHRKFTAFIMSLLICSAAFAPQTVSVYADNESEASASESVPEEDDSLKTSGDYSYSVTELGTVCIEGYSGSDTEIVIPDSLDGIEVTNIARDAFENAAGATSIAFPASVSYISGDNPFAYCTELKEIIVDEDNEDYTAEDGILYSKDKTQILCYPQAKKGTSFAVPEGVEEIGIAAFYQTALREITVPSSVTVINRHGMSYNSMLTSVDLSNTDIDYIADMAFSYCTGLYEIILPDTLTEIGGAAFAGCSALREVTLPESLLMIGQNAFAATGLTEIRIPASVLEIGYCAFGYDENLEPLDDFTIIGVSGSAAQIYATDTDETYDYANDFTFKTTEQAETEDSFEEFETIAYGEFGYAEVDGEAYITVCTSVDSVVEVPAEINGLPVTCIYAGAFFQNGLTEVVLPDTIKTIESLAFYMCGNLKSVTLHDGIVEIKNNAFDSCTALESVNISGTCETIGQEVFLGCNSLKEINISAAEGGNYSSEDGVLYNKDKTVLVAYPAARSEKKFTVPSSVTEIADSAFFNCTTLEKVDISLVTAIGEYAFENCTSLSSVKLAKEIKSIGICAFYNCTSLKSVRIYEAPSIGEYAFGFCYDSENLTDVLVDGFKIYAEEGGDGQAYSQAYGIECVTNTFNIFGYNVVKGFVYAVGAILAAVILAVIGIFTGKAIRKKKNSSDDSVKIIPDAPSGDSTAEDSAENTDADVKDDENEAE